MTYTEAEAKHFYWHCTTAALLLDNLEMNTATASHVHRAIRMATETACGKNGVRYASARAIEVRGTHPAKWTGIGLIREHAVPVSVITERVVDTHRSGHRYQWVDLLDKLTDDDRQNWRVQDSDAFHRNAMPFSAVVAAIVRDAAVLAWITEEEDALLKARGFTKNMPADAADNPLARYEACGIQIVAL